MSYKILDDKSPLSYLFLLVDRDRHCRDIYATKYCEGNVEDCNEADFRKKCRKTCDACSGKNKISVSISGMNFN